MHGHRCAGQNTDFEHAYECVFEDQLVTFGRGLHCVVAVRKIRLVFSVNIKIFRGQHKRTRDQNGEKRSPAGTNPTPRVVHESNLVAFFRTSHYQEARVQALQSGGDSLVNWPPLERARIETPLPSSARTPSCSGHVRGNSSPGRSRTWNLPVPEQRGDSAWERRQPMDCWGRTAKKSLPRLLCQTCRCSSWKNTRS